MLAPGVDCLLAEHVLLGSLGNRRAVSFAQDGDHLLFGESTLPHGLLVYEEPSSEGLSVRRSRPGHIHSQLRKIIKTRGHFPSDDAVTKLIWLALRNITADWGRAANEWREAMNQFAILYEERFTAAHAGR